jgi:hypothetical protein
MGPPRNGDPYGGDDLSDHDRRALATLERLAARSGLPGLWDRARFQLLVVWGARLALSVGVLLCVAALAAMWQEMSTHLMIAVASGLVLTAGALLVAHGLRLWWHWGRGRPKPER